MRFRARSSREHPGHLGVGLEDPLGPPGLEIREDPIVFAGMDVGLVQQRDESILLPGDVVLPTPGLLAVLLAVDVAAPPDLVEVVGKRVSTAGEDLVEADRGGGSGEGTEEVEEHGPGRHRPSFARGGGRGGKPSVHRGRP